MIGHGEKYDEMGELLLAMTDGGLSPRQRHRLAELVAGDVQLRDYYLAFVEVDAMLAWECGAIMGEPSANGPLPTASYGFAGPASIERRLDDAGLDDAGAGVRPHPAALPDPQDVGTASRSSPGIPLPAPRLLGPLCWDWPVAYLVATVMMAVGLLIGAHTYISLPKVAHQPQPETHAIAVSQKRVAVVGQITHMVDCVLENEECIVRNGALQTGKQGVHSLSLISPHSPVSLGDRFTLKSGLLEIAYDMGAKVIVQGPATYDVESQNSGFMHFGKLNGHVQAPQAKGFAITTPTAVVTDLGTEFGVEVDKQGTTTSHVFRGVVEVRSRNADGQPMGRAVRLTKDESVEVKRAIGGGEATLRRIKANPAVFVRSDQLPHSVDDLAREPFRRWLAYSEQLRTDPSLLAYYDFQLKPSRPSVLPNVAAGGDQSLDGVVENATWTTGRMPGKHALLFSNSADYVRVNLPQKIEDVTLVAWVCIYSLDNSLNALLMSDQAGQQRIIHWEVQADGCTEFGLIGSGSSSRPVFDGSRLCRWTHLALTYDHAAKELRLYADGGLVDKKAFPHHAGICIGPARIGHWDGSVSSPEAAPRNLHGRIDELAVFGRPLSENEVRRMYDEGKPVDDRATTRLSQ